jgi:hypothetical protein
MMLAFIRQYQSSFLASFGLLRQIAQKLHWHMLQSRCSYSSVSV